jgi:hypothetical protein
LKSHPPPTHKPQPNRPKSTTHQVSAVFCTVQATRAPSQSPKMPRALPTEFPLFFSWNSSKRTIARSSYPHIDDSGTSLSKAPRQEHHPPSFRCVLHCSSHTAPKPKFNDAKSLPTKFPLCFCEFQQTNHREQFTSSHDDSGTPLSNTNHNPIRPRAPPTKFPLCFAIFKRHGLQTNSKPSKSTTHKVSVVCCTVQTTRPPCPNSKMPRAVPTKFPLCFCEIQKASHSEKLTSSP